MVIIVCVCDDKVSIMDGFFVEIKEQLVGYYLLEVRDFNEVIQLVGKILFVCYGSIEVWLVRVLWESDNDGRNLKNLVQ